MRTVSAVCLTLMLGICPTLSSGAYASPSAATLARVAASESSSSMPLMLVADDKKVVVKDPIVKKRPLVVRRAPIVRAPLPFVQKSPPVYRRWSRRPHYGTIIAGIVLGTILSASAYYALSAPPDPDLCWYWANASRTRGYWDYCY